MLLGCFSPSKHFGVISVGWAAMTVFPKLFSSEAKRGSLRASKPSRNITYRLLIPTSRCSTHRSFDHLAPPPRGAALQITSVPPAERSSLLPAPRGGRHPSRRLQVRLQAGDLRNRGLWTCDDEASLITAQASLFLELGESVPALEMESLTVRQRFAVLHEQPPSHGESDSSRFAGKLVAYYSLRD
eukprot:TRINITY_DN27808_c0_g1_i1.p1 TRINITY_DN27808_c0_g1~~TRINITY_DN27808_c0_g1_i1.p1  ORF type:complete len:186 (+),score=18.98 TRINITY_DN27808_c0_g1_i1:57-614(+)